MSRRFDRCLLPPEPDLSFELELWSRGVRWVAGLDEAGRGALAGPAAVGALILPPEPAVAIALKGIRDSKALTPAQRAGWAVRLKALALGWAVGFAFAHEVDALGIAPAVRLAALRALEALPVKPSYLLLDYFSLPEAACPQTALVKGDTRALSIAGASILAKTCRDNLLRRLDEFFPGYGLAHNKGYGTAAHCQALRRLGPSPLHRRSFLRSILEDVNKSAKEEKCL